MHDNVWNILFTDGIRKHNHLTQGRSQRGKGEIPPPPKPQNFCRKMVLFPKALFLVTNFQKNQFFYRICFFRPNARKSNAWFDKFFEKYA